MFLKKYELMNTHVYHIVFITLSSVNIHVCKSPLMLSTQHRHTTAQWSIRLDADDRRTRSFLAHTALILTLLLIWTVVIWFITQFNNLILDIVIIYSFGTWLIRIIAIYYAMKRWPAKLSPCYWTKRAKFVSSMIYYIYIFACRCYFYYLRISH